MVKISARTGTTRGRMGALVAGALVLGGTAALPLVAAAPAQAASGATAYTCDITLTGGQASLGGEKAATITLDTDAPTTSPAGRTVTPTLTSTLTLDPAFAQQFVPSPVNRVTASLTAATSVGSAAGSSLVSFDTWERGGGIGSPVPAMTLTGSGPWGAIRPTQVGTLNLTAGTLTGTLSMGTIFSPGLTAYPMTCTPDSGAATAVDAITVTPREYNYSCEMDMSGVPGVGEVRHYEADVDFTIDAPATATAGEPFTPTVGATVEFADAFRAFLAGSPVTKLALAGDATTTTGAVEGAAPVTFPVWNRVLNPEIPSPSNQPIDPFVLTGSGSWGPITPAAVGTLPLSVQGLAGDLTLTAYGLALGSPIECSPIAGTAAATDSVDVVAPLPITNPTAPTVSGTRKVGSRLTATAGTWSPADVALAYQWLRDGTAIGGARSATYTAVPADLGKTLSVRVAATKSGHSALSKTVSAGKIAAGTQQVTGTAKVTGIPKVGKTLVVKAGRATGAKVSYQWLSNGKTIKGATRSSLKLPRTLAGKKVTVKVSYTRIGYRTVVQTTKALVVKK